MTLTTIKIVDKNDAAGANQARGDLTDAGFAIVYEGDADGVLVDTVRAGGHDDTYGAAWVIVGKKN